MRKPTRSSKNVSLNRPENSGVTLLPTSVEASRSPWPENVARSRMKVERTRRGDVDRRADTAARRRRHGRSCRP